MSGPDVEGEAPQDSTREQTLAAMLQAQSEFGERQITTLNSLVTEFTALRDDNRALSGDVRDLTRRVEQLGDQLRDQNVAHQSRTELAREIWTTTRDSVASLARSPAVWILLMIVFGVLSVRDAIPVLIRAYGLPAAEVPDVGGP